MFPGRWLGPPVRASAEKSSIIYCASWFINEPVNAIQTCKLVSHVSIINIDALTRIRDCTVVLWTGTACEILKTLLYVSCLQRADGIAVTADA